ncbi:MAG: hypothetical protein NPIRA06_21860 [Nitrospirales bacterium]|nr:MAG: hypothetical protein NPIRA06_21860 [Nitrospirales bacterium]
MERDHRLPLNAFSLKSIRTGATVNEKNPSASGLFSFHQTGDSARENFRTSIFVVMRPKKIRGITDEMTSLANHGKGEKRRIKREMKIPQGLE